MNFKHFNIKTYIKIAGTVNAEEIADRNKDYKHISRNSVTCIIHIHGSWQPGSQSCGGDLAQQLRKNMPVMCGAFTMCD
jgi:hypothetical protein